MSEVPLIAYVDDDAAVREALQGLLLAFGYETEVFASAEDLLQSRRAGRMDCIITDMRLGGMSGLELLKQLTAAGHHVPTVVITAFADCGTVAQSLDAGALAVLRKPILGGELLSVIRAALADQSRGEMKG